MASKPCRKSLGIVEEFYHLTVTPIACDNNNSISLSAGGLDAASVDDRRLGGSRWQFPVIQAQR